MAADVRLVAERRFRAMGADAHIVVNGPEAERAADGATARVADLEARWSRFRPDSEVCSLNARAGETVTVSSDTFDLIDKAVFAWHVTGGAFDPTMLAALEAIGYDRTFDEIATRDDSPMTHRRSDRRPSAGARQVVLDRSARTVTLQPDAQFDPGGLGKGLAADVVTGELLAAGAWGAMVNLGGDLRVRGVPPTGLEWVVGIREPEVADELLASVRLQDAGVATSTTLRRRWSSPSGLRHHLLDAATKLPYEAGADLCTVVAGEAWWAEVCATVLIGPHPAELPNQSALRVFADGHRELLGSFARHTF